MKETFGCLGLLLLLVVIGLAIAIAPVGGDPAPALLMAGGL